jgi:hypothetical protein
MTKKNNDERREGVKRQILEAFFHFRSNLPEVGYVQQNRSTQELLDELNTMYNFSENDIVDYLSDNDYAPTTEPDGSVKWAIWRLIHE